MTPFIVNQSTNMKETPIPPETHLALRVYRLVHGCCFPTLGDLLDVSKSLAPITLNKFVSTLVVTMYDDYMKLPFFSGEWETQLRGFIENYEFSCAWTDSAFM